MVLLEQGEQLGGTLRIASFPTGKGQISAAVRSMIVRCQQAGVEIRTGTRATPELLRQLAPDAAILATRLRAADPAHPRPGQLRLRHRPGHAGGQGSGGRPGSWWWAAA